MGQRIIGLTGGIATGKSTVSQYLRGVHHIPVLDADDYARQAVAVGSPVLGAIAERYGPTILHPDGSLNRSHLGEVVFNNPTERAWLERQIHPVVRHYFHRGMVALAGVPTVAQAIPLLFEANLTDQVTEIWVVVCSPAQQRQRLMDRNGLTVDQAEARMASQVPLATKIAQADVVLDNAQDLEYLFRQVDQALDQSG